MDPATGESAVIADVSVPGVDGIVLQGRRLWAVQGFSNQITELRLTGGPDGRDGRRRSSRTPSSRCRRRRSGSTASSRS